MTEARQRLTPAAGAASAAYVQNVTLATLPASNAANVRLGRCDVRTVRSAKAACLSMGAAYPRKADGAYPSPQGRGLRAEEGEFMVAEAEKVVAYGTVEGTHHGDFFDLAATGKRFKVHNIDICRFNDEGLIAEHWGIVDVAGMMRQLS